MINRLPKWVWPASGALAFIAGLINVVGLLGFEHQAVTHLTGTTSLLSQAVAMGSWDKALRLSGVVLAFVTGAAVGGTIVGDQVLTLNRRHGVALGIEALLVFASAMLFQAGSLVGVYLVSAAAGLQNAIGTTFSGAIVRTTHVTGSFTDLGILIGRLMRRNPADRKRLALSFILICGFIGGGICGTWLYGRLGYSSLVPIAGVIALASLGCLSRRTSINVD